MGKLGAALEWASRGFRVFPLVENGKAPIHDEWYDVATSDESAIRAMWTDPVLKSERDYNIGVDTTDMVVVDVDVKEGKDGHNQYMHLGGSYDTLVVRTPTGGFHCYFEGPDSANVSIASDVDIRSHHGYVVAPGSTIDNVPYTVVTDGTPQWVPLSVEKLLQSHYERRQIAQEGAYLDSEASIEAGRRYLESAPPAIQGQRGDETTFVTAARLVREFALSPQTAFELMAAHWNEKCIPPWSLDELAGKVENAAQYGTADVGRLDPSVSFAAVDVSSPPSVFEQKALDFGNALDPGSIPPRPWVVDKMLMLHELTLLLAHGGAGKSSVSLAIAAHLALGRDFGPYKTRTQCKSVVYNGEDDRVEMSRRLYAVCMSYGLDYDAVKSRVLLVSSDDIDMRLVVSQGRQSLANEAVVNQLIDVASDPDVGLLVLDPLVDVHEVDEGDNPQMNFVMKTLKHIVRDANVCALVLHHTTKAGSTRQEDRIGNMDISRGASGIVNKARISFTLLNASHQDAEEYGLQETERLSWVRMDDAKMNLALAAGDPCWFHKEGVRIPNGDVIGVLKHQTLNKNTNHLRVRIAEAIMATMSANGSASMPMVQTVALLKSKEPLWANKTDNQIRQRVEGMFAQAIEIRGRTLQVVREEGAKGTVLVVMS